MNRDQKGVLVDGLTSRFSKAATIYVADFTGLRVKHVTDLRRRLRSTGSEFVVVKNTLARRALGQASVSGLEDVLAGPTGLVFTGGDPVGPAKILAEFQREFEQFTVKAGLFEGRPVGPEHIRRLASLPSRVQLLGEVGGALQAPMTAFAGALNGLLYQMVGALEALRSQRASAA